MKSPLPKKIRDEFIPIRYPIKSKQNIQQIFEAKDISFLDVLFSRRSTMDFSPTHSIRSEIEELLFYCCHIKEIEIDGSGFIISKRVVPSGGARHPIDLLISFPGDLFTRTLSYYNPLDHSLGELEIPATCLNDFLQEINENAIIQNACVIWFSIQTAKTGSKYENPESLYWRDTGALLYCIQLVATYLGLKSCPLGTLATTSFNNLFASDELQSGGGILIGR